MMKIKIGSSRICILTKNYAFKIPRLSPYRSFLRGLLANLQEQSFWKYCHYDELCPIVFSLPLGFMNVMYRASELNENDFPLVDSFLTNLKIKDYDIPFESDKLSSLGKLNGKIVIVDYGD